MNPFLPDAPACLLQLEEHIPEAMRLGQSATADLSLAAYSAAMRQPFLLAAPIKKKQERAECHPLQDGEDLVALAATETTRLLSPAHGKAIIRSLEDDFRALTANHHGADFHPEFVQGTLIYALDAIKRNARAIPVFACGGVPRHNVGFPRGILLGRGTPESTIPRRFPVLPDKNRRTMVSMQSPLLAADVERARKALALTEHDGTLLPAEVRAVARLLNEVFAPDAVLGQRCYRDQATVMNSLLWPLLFVPGIAPPYMVSLDMQFLCGKLVAQDLTDSGSLLSKLILEPECTLTLYRELNGARGCWQTVPDSPSDTQTDAQPDGPQEAMRGTFLFWALDDKGRPTPLRLHPSGRALFAEGNEDQKMDLTASAMAQGLAEEKIMPGLYLYFAATALARGLVCCGGVFQTEYMSAMRDGTARALSACGEHAVAERVAARPGSPMSTGFLPLRALPSRSGSSGSREREAWPCGGYAASPVDLLTHGGLNADDLDHLETMSMGEAFAAALAYQYEDLVPDPNRESCWLSLLTSNIGLLLAPLE